jgi:hypothetical protein
MEKIRQLITTYKAMLFINHYKKRGQAQATPRVLRLRLVAADRAAGRREKALSRKESDVQRSGHFHLGAAGASGVAALVGTPFDSRAQGANAIAIDSDDIAGGVRGPGGP